jgi:dihydroflavonol-4-reductase
LPPQEIIDVNVEGTRNICDAALSADCPRLVMTSTFSTLGSASTSDGTPIRPSPRQLSTTTKIEAEDLVKDYISRRGLRAAIVNPTYFIGPYDYRPSPFRLLIPWIIGRPLPVVPSGGFNVVSAAQVASVHIDLLFHGNVGEQRIVTGTDVQIRDYVALAADVVGRRRPSWVIPPYLLRLLARHRVFDIYVADLLSRDNFARALATPDRVALRSVVHETVNWFVSTGTLNSFRALISYIRHNYR